jgi:periplasmic divalent cation tolerance protein
MIIMYVTCKDNLEARVVAKALLEKKLVACANIVESKSLYNASGELVEQDEAILLLKTKKDKYDDVKAEIVKLHSYNVPCILRVDVTSNKEYFDWVCKELE